MSEGAPATMVLSRIFLLALVAVTTLTFLWLIAPFSGAVLWAVIAAVLFEPLNERVLRAMPRRRGNRWPRLLGARHPRALLWGVAMGVFSLFPAIGTGLIWVPVTLYLLATGAIWQGIVLGACGFFVISSVDNVVRPILVGRDARMPDYVVLIATLGGFELMGFNGFVVGPVIAALFMAVWDIFSAAEPSKL